MGFILPVLLVVCGTLLPAETKVSTKEPTPKLLPRSKSEIRSGYGLQYEHWGFLYQNLNSYSLIIRIPVPTFDFPKPKEKPFKEFEENCKGITGDMTEVTAMFIHLRFENVKSQQCLFECEVTAMFIRLRFENVNDFEGHHIREQREIREVAERGLQDGPHQIQADTRPDDMDQRTISWSLMMKKGQLVRCDGRCLMCAFRCDTQLP